MVQASKSQKAAHDIGAIRLGRNRGRQRPPYTLNDVSPEKLQVMYTFLKSKNTGVSDLTWRDIHKNLPEGINKRQVLAWMSRRLFELKLLET